MDPNIEKPRWPVPGPNFWYMDLEKTSWFLTFSSFASSAKSEANGLHTNENSIMIYFIFEKETESLNYIIGFLPKSAFQKVYPNLTFGNFSYKNPH